MGIFSKLLPKPDPQEKVKKWILILRQEMSNLERQIRSIKREEEKAKRSLKDAAKKGNKDLCIILAKEILRARKAINKLIASKAHMNSMLLQMTSQLSILRMAGAMQKSTELMKTMNNLMKASAISNTMRDMSKEMMKTGIIGEILENTVGNDDFEDVEEEGQSEIDKVFWEITAGTLGQASIAVIETPTESVLRKTETIKKDDVLEQLDKRLKALKS